MKRSTLLKAAGKVTTLFLRVLDVGLCKFCCCLVHQHVVNSIHVGLQRNDNRSIFDDDTATCIGRLRVVEAYDTLALYFK
ncbi:hypothetical protein PF005_g14128 [Phytophthora fragariae]|uniref:Secreted protein n=1 Tax=Phytophthora fragariae TaxID=53985 RepID=A0A6A3KBN8_9STRA|nr:hypothetical protein PF003_g4982 [Phytophthora fragariae]KAE8935385.1 hypothetical protein PF009_g14669 [Phytophthora fragariae]KAE9003017.1 hypothetical protein PF011_g13066 [Phytophthora fragariae]KAE9103258.1 hypothetical protein PF010_g13793 [Phytophthora fragariae]KAE9103458.1 hypothetical protein PF007_g14398 [Phytophthora fragariae]